MSITRTELIRGRLSGRAIRPPWALSEAAFIERCNRCQACVEACPEHIVKRAAGGFPAVDFREGPCTFCGRCADVCQPTALDRNHAPWHLAARIDPACLAHNRITCRSCGDACDEAAIAFPLKLGGVPKPRVDRSRCTGCGACVGVCPVDAVGMVDLQGICEESC